MTIEALQSSPDGLIPQVENLQFRNSQAQSLLESLANHKQSFLPIERSEFNTICDEYEGQKGISYISYDAKSQTALRAKKPKSNIEIFTIKKNGKIIAARFNTTSLTSDDVKNIFYFKAV